MKFLLVLTLISTLSYANDKKDEEAEPTKGLTKKDYKDAESKLLVEAIGEKAIEDSISQSPEFKECSDKKTKSEVESCMQQKMSELDEAKLSEYAKKTSKGIINQSSSKKNKSIKDFMSDRIKRLVYGVKNDKDVDTKQFVNHNVFRKIYQSQIAKNLLLEVNNYCLSTVGTSDPRDLVLFAPISTDQKASPTDASFTIYNWSNGKYIKSSTDKNLEFLNSLRNKTNKIREWSVCDSQIDDPLRVVADGGKKPKDACSKVEVANSTPVRQRSTADISDIKNYQIELAADAQKNLLYNNFSACSQVVVRKMCNYFKCTTQSDFRSANKECKDDFNLDASSAVDANSIVGQKACNLYSRLKEYRKVSKVIVKMNEEESKAQAARRVSLKYNEFGNYKKNFNGNVETITTISSKEFSSGLEVIGDEDLKRLEEECFLDDGNGGKTVDIKNEECKNLAGYDDVKRAADIETESLAEMELYNKRVQDLKDKDSLKAFLQKTGKYDEFASKIEELDLDNLKKLVTGHYKGEKEALRVAMMEKFNKARGEDIIDKVEKMDSNAKIQSMTDSAKTNLAGKASEKERLATLFEYSNIVSSFLAIEKEGKGNDKKTEDLSYMRRAEIEGIEDENKKQRYEKLFENHENGVGRELSSSRKKDDGGIQTLGIVDKFLGFEQPTESGK